MPNSELAQISPAGRMQIIMDMRELYKISGKPKLKVYVARAMSGLNADEVVKTAKEQKSFLESCGYEVLCPVVSEGVKAVKKPIQSTKKLMDTYWARDKQMIREADIVFVMSPDRGSLGCIREYGYARYHLQKKVITVFPEGNLPKEGAVCYYEDDYVTDSLVLAAGAGLETHGTYWKRLKWKLGVLNRSLVKSIIHQAQEWLPTRSI